MWLFGKKREPARELLESCKTIAIVGLSDNPERPSYRIAQYLQKHGYHIIPVNPMVTEVLGQKAYPDLGSIPVPFDLVNVFRAEDELTELFDEALEQKVPAIWLQPGLHCAEGEQRALMEGIPVFTDHCIMMEHKRLFG